MKKYFLLTLILALVASTGVALAVGETGGTSASVGVGTSGASSNSSDPTLQILNPKGREFFAIGLPMRIKWQASSNFGDIKIEWREPVQYGRSGTIATVPVANGFYDWTPTEAVGVLPASTYYITLRSVNNPRVVSESVYPFTINASASEIPTISLKTPKKNEVWRRGETKFISWNTTNVPSTAFINIRLVDVNTGKVSEIVSKVPNSGSATWKVEKRKNLDTKLDELIPYGKYKVRACVAGLLGGCDKTGGDVNIEVRPASDGLAAAVINAIRSLFGL